jgi:hypothetical protein
VKTYQLIDHAPQRPLTSHRRWTACVGLVVALSVPAASALARDDIDAAEPGDGAYCSTTARLLNAACGFEAKDDFYLAKAKCINLSDGRDRASCLTGAARARSEGGKLCSAQLEARRALCSVFGEGRYDPPFTPDLFDSDFRKLSNPNPYFPLGIGHRWEFRGGTETTTLEVLNQTKLIEGVACIVLRDLVYDKGRLKEATDDWFAAGRDGSTWYCGEEVKDYESFDADAPVQPELISIDGSFKHGRDGDKAGIIMPTQPRAGQVYLEEFSLGNAEDMAEVLSSTYVYGADTVLDRLVPRELAQRLCGNRDCVVTRNTSPMAPGIYALKYYARGIGFFLETKPVQGESLQLVACNFDPRCASLPAP